MNVAGVSQNTALVSCGSPPVCAKVARAQKSQGTEHWMQGVSRNAEKRLTQDGKTVKVSHSTLHTSPWCRSTAERSRLAHDGAGWSRRCACLWSPRCCQRETLHWKETVVPWCECWRAEWSARREGIPSRRSVLGGRSRTGRKESSLLRKTSDWRKAQSHQGPTRQLCPLFPSTKPLVFLDSPSMIFLQI